MVNKFYNRNLTAGESHVFLKTSGALGELLKTREYQVNMVKPHGNLVKTEFYLCTSNLINIVRTYIHYFVLYIHGTFSYIFSYKIHLCTGTSIVLIVFIQTYFNVPPSCWFCPSFLIVHTSKLDFHELFKKKKHEQISHFSGLLPTELFLVQSDSY